MLLRIIDAPARDLCALDVQNPEPTGQRLMDPLNNDIRVKRLGVGHHMREICYIGRHPVENFGREPSRSMPTNSI